MSFTAILILSMLSSCSDVDNPIGIPPLPATIEIGTNASPEDVKEYNGFLYTSNFFTGAITRVKLSDLSTSTFVSAPTSVYNAGWGLNINPSKNWLLSIRNKPYDFNPANAIGQMGIVNAYNIETGVLERSWNLPEGCIGNAIDVDNAGNIYVSDIGPNARIVKIDVITNVVSVWADGTNFTDGGFGLGGMIFNKTNGFYYSQNKKLFFVGIDSNGAAQESIEVNTGGAEVDADGMTWAGNNTIYYNFNDVFISGAQGFTGKIVLSNTTTGIHSIYQTGLRDSSGIFFSSYANSNYLFVCESQFGYAFGIDNGNPANPFIIKVYKQ
ncbi:hypothetical protein [Flavobacterium sp. J27]|uniref:hypothetical protein n=1 Tax=Flavobacterium sp. J27 TaxID=2060419 RepID=UPI001031F2E2|nr:hypothetical protein [Flavobacterium sp. J27]